MICVRLDGDVMFLIAGKTCGVKIDILGKYGIMTLCVVLGYVVHKELDGG